MEACIYQIGGGEFQEDSCKSIFFNETILGFETYSLNSFTLHMDSD